MEKSELPTDLDSFICIFLVKWNWESLQEYKKDIVTHYCSWCNGCDERRNFKFIAPIFFGVPRPSMTQILLMNLFVFRACVYLYNQIGVFVRGPAITISCYIHWEKSGSCKIRQIFLESSLITNLNKHKCQKVRKCAFKI